MDPSHILDVSGLKRPAGQALVFGPIGLNGLGRPVETTA
jgi:hypothetical protein